MNSSSSSDAMPAPPADTSATHRRPKSLADAYRLEIAAYFGLLIIAALDRAAPPEMSLALLYMVPLGAVAWLGPRGVQWRMTLASICIWTLLDAPDDKQLEWWLFSWLIVEKVTLFTGTTYLLSRLRKALRAQRQLSRVLAERLRVVEQLAAGVAHEVRNPLGTLISGIEYLGRHDRPEVEKMLVQDMHGAAIRAEVIVRDLNDFSAPLRLHLAPIDIVSAVRQATREATAKADAAGVRINVRASEPVQVDADLTRIVQVLVNLLRNAIDVTPRGGTVRITVQAGPCGVSVDVDDDGPGIPPERLSQVFEPFFTTKAPGAGTGLGLAVSQRIAEDHHGELRLANRPDRGLRASLTLPNKGQHA